MKDFPDKSIDMVLCDPPYGTTSRNEWDNVIPFKPFWKELNRVITDHGAIVMFSQLPFMCDLIQSNREYFRYEWVYEKSVAVGFLNVNRMPLRSHENILVFYKHLPTYNPQKTQGKPYYKNSNSETTNYDHFDKMPSESKDGSRYPRDVLKINNAVRTNILHPTQKPLKLCEYMVKTYTNPGDTVLDCCMGSGTTGKACLNTGRSFIGIEKNKDYYDIAVNRLNDKEAG